MIKYLKREDLSSQDKDIKIVTNPGSTINGMPDYIKRIIRRKPDVLLIHSDTDDLINNVNSIKKVRDLVKCICDLDRKEVKQIDFPSIISRQDGKLEKEINETKTKLRKFYKGKEFVFVGKCNIHESCLNNSKLHLNRKALICYPTILKNH